MAEATALGRLAEGALPLVRREFDRLVARHHRQAYNAAYRLTGNHADAEDLTQEAFVRAFRFFDTYRRDLPFENWLLRILSNLHIDRLRRSSRFRTQSLDAPLGNDPDSTIALEIPDTRTSPESAALCGELDDMLHKALETVPLDFRRAVILADIEGLSYERISEIVGCNIGTVRSRLHRGRKLLRARLMEMGVV